MRNIIAITFDSLRADHCGHLGYNRNTTSSLDRMANQGISFTNAIAPASRTNPSMAGIFTGESMNVRDQVSNNENSRNHINKYGTIAEDLNNKGYTTGAFCPNAYASRYYGFDKGFDHFEDFLFSSDKYRKLFKLNLTDSKLYSYLRNIRNYIRKQEAFKTWDTYIDNIEKWVENVSEPFFLWVFSLDTHFPYITPWKYRQWGSLFDMYYYNWYCNRIIDEFDIDMSKKDKERIVNIYDDCVKFGDILIKKLEDSLSQYDPIYLIFGDHGEAFGEHGTYGHFYPSLYEENTHVPFVIYSDDIKSDTFDSPYSLLNMRKILNSIARGRIEFPNSEGKFAFATDYDGRWNRNLISVRSNSYNYILEDKGEEVSEFITKIQTNKDNSIQLDKHRELAVKKATHQNEQINIEIAAKVIAQSSNI